LERSKVNCNGCTLCCCGDLIFLHPEDGDDPGQYDTKVVRNPLTGRLGLALKHKDNGECIYLGADGCAIHDRSPVICQEFNCAKYYKAFIRRYNKKERKELEAKGFIAKDVFEEGKKRWKQVMIST
jgi:Fe-S-cluster containining protein